MDKSEYQGQLNLIFSLAALSRGLKAREVLQAMNRAETLGPILDPTTYVKSVKRLEWQKRTVQATLEFQQAIAKITSEQLGM